VVEEPILQPASCTGPQGADTTSAPTLEWHRISWPRPRIEVWERAIAGAHVGVGLRVHLLPDEQQAHDFVEVGLRDQTGLIEGDPGPQETIGLLHCGAINH
jgi:hypothetical protein